MPDVLLASKHSPDGDKPVGGVQTWVATMREALLARGYRVTVWEPKFGPVSGWYDIGIFANWAHTSSAAASCGELIKVAHGVIEDERGDESFFATSEEVAFKWRCARGIIRQPLNLDFWSPGEEGARDLLVRHSYRRGLDFLPDVAAAFGLRYTAVTGDQNAREVRLLLRRAKVVVATGRAAVEAMACGARVIIADDREYQGPLLSTDPIASMPWNYSGRPGIPATPKTVTRAISSATEPRKLLSHVAYHHDVNAVLKRLELC